MNPPQQLLNWTIHTTSGLPETVTAIGYQIAPDGSIVFGDQFGPTVAFNARLWDKVTRSSIQPAQGGNS